MLKETPFATVRENCHRFADQQVFFHHCRSPVLGIVMLDMLHIYSEPIQIQNITLLIGTDCENSEL